MATPTVDSPITPVTPACEFEDDSVPSYTPQRVQSAGWVPTPSPHQHRGTNAEKKQDFSILGIMEAQQGAKLVHQQSLTTILYNLLKTQNSFDLNVITQNNLEKMICDFQREDSRWTFLMQAAYWNNESVARWLFTQGADPFVRNASNQTALDVALNERNINVAEIIRIRMAELQQKKTTKPSNPIDIKSQQSR